MLRSRVGVAVMQNRLFAIGGYNGQERLNTVEVSDIWSLSIGLQFFSCLMYVPGTVLFRFLIVATCHLTWYYGYLLCWDPDLDVKIMQKKERIKSEKRLF